jgi:hypothetical protein
VKEIFRENENTKLTFLIIYIYTLGERMAMEKQWGKISRG